MDQRSNQNSSIPVQQTSPEEDATLLAIEALEARSVDPNPRPLTEDPSRVAPRPAPTVPPIQPKATIEPVKAPTLVVSAPQPVQPKPVEPEKPAEPKPIPESKPVVIQEVKPKKPATTAEEIAEALAGAPAPSRYPFFAYSKPPRKPFIILGVVVILIGLGAVAYFAIH